MKRSALALALIGCLATVSCDETKSAKPMPGDSTPTMTEPTDDSPAASDVPRAAKWTPGGPAPTESAPQVDPANASRQGWAIVFESFTSADHRQLAEKYVYIARQISPFTDFWIETDDRGSAVRYGSYPSVDSKEAQADLTKIKQFEYQSQRWFEKAYLSPIVSTASGRLREYNLVQARRLFPREDTVYSLQIGVYEAEQPTSGSDSRRISSAEARHLAEEAVLQLRSQGEMAFYYHGPNRSMVCIGAFPSTAVDAATGLYSPDVVALQRRYPTNSLNGRVLQQEILTKSGQRRMEQQPSFLVEVPKE